MNILNMQLKQIPWAGTDKLMPDASQLIAFDLTFYGGGAGDAGQNQEDKEEEPDINKAAIDKMNARRGAGDSTKADSGGGDADKRVVNRDVDTGPVNNDRGA